MKNQHENPLPLLTELLKIPSITPNDGGCQDILIKRLQKRGFHIERFNFNKTSNFFARLGEKAPFVCFAGHTDVVPPGPLTAWHSDPFVPTLREGKLYGRGAADMKSGLAAMMTSIEAFLSTHPDFNGSLGVLVTSDEEGSGKDGTRKVVELLKRRDILITYAIVAEPTARKNLGDSIKNGRRGSAGGTLTIKGQQGHIAYPQLASNPIHTGLPALTELINTQWDEGNNYFSPTVLQLSNIHAGVGASNVIPEKMKVQFNFRFSPESHSESLKKRFEAILTAHQVHYHLDWQCGGQPFLTKEGQLINAAKKAITQIVHRSPSINTEGGTSDGRFIKEISSELIELGVQNASIHQANEWVEVEEVIALSRIYEVILNLLLIKEETGS
jgi:succinyl-diaminopimelate desuccinylase